MEDSVTYFESDDEQQEFATTSVHVTNKQQSIQNEIIDLCSSDDEEPSLKKIDAKSVSRINSISCSVNTHNVSNLTNRKRKKSISSFQGTGNSATLPDVCQTTKKVADPTYNISSDDSDSSSNNTITGVSFGKPVPAALPLLPSESMPNCLNVEYIMVLDESLDYTADFPPVPISLIWSRIPDDPSLNPRAILKWDFDTENKVEGIESFQIFYYKLDKESSFQHDEWDIVGTVKALPMPMACTIQLANVKNVTYFFSLRAKDIHNRYGRFSMPCRIKI